MVIKGAKHSLAAKPGVKPQVQKVEEPAAAPTKKERKARKPEPAKVELDVIEMNEVFEEALIINEESVIEDN